MANLYKSFVFFNPLKSKPQNSVATMATSAMSATVAIVEDAHCKLRQEQRRISKVDLAAAMKYGSKTKTVTPHGPNKGLERWMFEYRGTTYITDIQCQRQITCWAKGMTFEEIPIMSDRREYLEEHREFLKQHPGNISNHTVFVVDQSGSMKLSDVPGARSRHFAVFSSILLDYLLESIVNPQANNGHDVITIMEMRDSTSVLLENEPLDELTYNKVIRLMNERNPRGQGNFIPAFKSLYSLLASRNHTINHNKFRRGTIEAGSSCKKAETKARVIFLSDGRPSDKKLGCGNFLGQSQSEWVLENVKGGVEQIASSLGKKCSFTFVSFGAASSGRRSHDFLVQLSAAAKQAGSEAEAIDTETSTERLGSVLTSISATATAHCTALAVGEVLEPKRLLAIDEVPLAEQIQQLSEGRRPNLKYFDVISTSNDALKRATFQRVKGQKHWDPVPRGLLTAGADGLAISKRPFAHGGERFAFIAREVVGSKSPLSCRFVGDWLVAKQSSRRYKAETARGFHVMYTKLQKTSGRLAVKFNDRLQHLENSLGCCLPRVEFLECFVYTWAASEVPRPDAKQHQVHWGDTECECLVEPLLDANQSFIKFNNNYGYVGEGAVKADLHEADVKNFMSSQSVHESALVAVSEDEEDEEPQSTTVSQTCLDYFSSASFFF